MGRRGASRHAGAAGDTEQATRGAATARSATPCALFLIPVILYPRSWPLPPLDRSLFFFAKRRDSSGSRSQSSGSLWKLVPSLGIAIKLNYETPAPMTDRSSCGNPPVFPSAAFARCCSTFSLLSFPLRPFGRSMFPLLETFNISSACIKDAGEKGGGTGSNTKRTQTVSGKCVSERTRREPCSIGAPSVRRSLPFACVCFALGSRDFCYCGTRQAPG